MAKSRFGARRNLKARVDAVKEQFGDAVPHVFSQKSPIAKFFSRAGQ
jgi:hypothetical protein